MSAPNTNPEKQARQHRGPLTGMAMMVLWAAVLLVGLLVYVSMSGGEPEGAEARVDGRTGVVEEAGGGTEGAVATDDASQAAARADGAAPEAVAVPAETVTAPQTGAGNAADTDPGESQAAEPLDPVDGGGAGGGATAEERAAEPAGN